MPQADSELVDDTNDVVEYPSLPRDWHPGRDPQLELEAQQNAGTAMAVTLSLALRPATHSGYGHCQWHCQWHLPVKVTASGITAPGLWHTSTHRHELELEPSGGAAAGAAGAASTDGQN